MHRFHTIYKKFCLLHKTVQFLYTLMSLLYFYRSTRVLPFFTERESTNEIIFSSWCSCSGKFFFLTEYNIILSVFKNIIHIIAISIKRKSVNSYKCQSGNIREVFMRNLCRFSIIPHFDSIRRSGGCWYVILMRCIFIPHYFEQ